MTSEPQTVFFTARAADRGLSKILFAVERGAARVVITSRGRARVAIVGLADLELIAGLHGQYFAAEDLAGLIAANEEQRK